MLAPLALAAALWALGSLLRASLRAKLGMLAALWLGIVAAHLALAEGHPLRVATGGEVRPWLALGVLTALVLAYRAALLRLRRRAARRAAPAPPAAPFSEAELNRYARHIMLRELGGPGQRRLKDARVLVVGAGGLGSPVLLYLAAAGVGTLGVIDDDIVEASNLQRQILHTDDSLGMPKVFSAQARLKALNPFVAVAPYNRRLDEENARALIAGHDLVIDGSDNFDTRYLVNRVCAELGKPLIAGAMTQWEGQISLWDPARGTPCYACVFPHAPAAGLAPDCAVAGVVAPLPGVIGSQMALEAVKWLTGAGRGLGGRLLIHDALWAETRMIAIHPRADCPVCAAHRQQSAHGVAKDGASASWGGAAEE